MSGTKCTPKDAQASTPQSNDREEVLRRFDDASRAFYLLVDSGRTERLEEVGGLMDRLAREAGLAS